ncbi:MAG TPA: SlyX family protein [Cycloclasticus sp.]|jgi:SlyX protein|nr:SlyX family protein [Cycloclasticus sp.]
MENRITELEIKVAYQEDTVQQLDRVICKQQDQIDSLIKSLTQLSDNAQEPEATTSLFSAIDDVPPHY